MNRLLAWLCGFFLLLLLAAGGLFFAVLDDQALVRRDETISPTSVAQARWLVLSNDPRQLRAGEARQLPVPAALLDDGINYLASRFLHGRGALVVNDQGAEIRLTMSAPPPLSGRFINLRARVNGGTGAPKVASAHVGALPIPAMLVDAAIDLAITRAGYQREWLLARRSIIELGFNAPRQRIIVAYIWDPALLDHARAIAVNPEDLARLRAAQETLAALLDHQAPGAQIALPKILGPLLDVAGADQRENRRAAIFVLGIYLADKNIATLIPQAANWPRPRPVMLTLQNRHDSAQHFVVSATLSAWAGEPLADAVGIYKELADANHGSGFSFADIAADRAGTRFGELIVNQPAAIDQLLHRPFADADIAPTLADLPEDMQEAQFRKRFIAPGSAPYKAMQQEIERRLQALPLYRSSAN